MLSTNLIRPKVPSSNSIASRRKPEILSSTPSNSIGGNITTVVDDTIVAQKKLDRARRSSALRKKLIISSEDDLDSSLPEDDNKVPSMESIPVINDSTGELFSPLSGHVVILF